jgi:hypothetical protein
MFNKGPGSAALAPGWGWSRSRISWGAVLAGAAVAVASSMLLGLLGAALGAGWVQPFNLWNDIGRLGVGATLWQIVNLALSMLLGGYVAARLSGTHSHQDGELHGLTTWAVATLLGSLLLWQLLGGLAGMLGQGVGSAVSRVMDTTGAARLIPQEFNIKAQTDRLRQSLGSSGDLTTMSHEQIGAEINSLVETSLTGDLSDQDHDRLVALVAAESGVTREEAARRVLRLENDAKESRTQVEQKVRAAAETVAQSTAIAARALFTGLTTGLLGALIGAWFGTLHKRTLHPQEYGREGYVPAYGARTAAYGTSGTAYERAEPMSVSVYDDTGRLVSQYLRGVSFPVSKQELLRMARSGSADADMLRAIERMPDRRYTSVHDVIEALGMAHAS